MRGGSPSARSGRPSLQAYLDKWAVETDHGGRRGPFDGTRLTGAEASWLAEQSGREVNGFVPNLQLEGADLDNAHLEGASLNRARLERATLATPPWRGPPSAKPTWRGPPSRAQLEGADLSYAWLDSKTVFTDARLNDKTRLADIQWGGVGAVNLTRLNWDAVHMLGDERSLTRRLESRATMRRAVRAYRQVAAQLRAQGMSEVADRFLYRAQVRQRQLLLRRGRILTMARLVAPGRARGLRLPAWPHHPLVFWRPHRLRRPLPQLRRGGRAPLQRRSRRRCSA